MSVKKVTDMAGIHRGHGTVRDTRRARVARGVDNLLLITYCIKSNTRERAEPALVRPTDSQQREARRGRGWLGVLPRPKSRLLGLLLRSDSGPNPGLASIPFPGRWSQMG